MSPSSIVRISEMVECVSGMVECVSETSEPGRCLGGVAARRNEHLSAHPQRPERTLYRRRWRVCFRGIGFCHGGNQPNGGDTEERARWEWRVRVCRPPWLGRVFRTISVCS